MLITLWIQHETHIRSTNLHISLNANVTQLLVHFGLLGLHWLTQVIYRIFYFAYIWLSFTLVICVSKHGKHGKGSDKANANLVLSWLKPTTREGNTGSHTLI